MSSAAAPPRPMLIAEIGCNHRGDFDTAREMIRTAARFCEVPCVKFQKRNPAESLTEAEYAAPHPEPRHAYGPTYGAHREFLEFSVSEHRTLQALCGEWGVAYACSVWDLTSARDIAALSPAFIKVPSACNTHFELAACLCDTYGGPIHVSLGMTTEADVDAIVACYAQRGRAKDLVLYHCVSGYPVPFDQLCLLEIPRLAARYGSAVKAIGFSGHHLGIAVDLAAYALGATHLERHFTLDRTWQGTDHAASLEPDGLRRLWRDLNAAHAALREKPAEGLPIEAEQRRKLKWDRGAP